MSTHNISPELQTATIGGGCFWCLDPIFADLNGVHEVVSGYAGGHVVDPTYEHVCSKQTGHAEVVKIRFDAAVITYRELLQIFFTVHDPTTLNRQGNDVGPQYRSVIMYHNQEQRAIAEEIIHTIDAVQIWGRPIITELVPYSTFYDAETYHQAYFSHNPNQGYCRIVIAPKVAKFRKHYAKQLKQPVAV